jgi:hypothetical protein
MESTSISKFDFIKEEQFRICLEDAYSAVDEMNLWNYLRDNIFNSFTYYSGPDKELHDELSKKADKHNMHSGASYGITMRNMEQIAKNGFEQWKTDYIKNYYSQTTCDS